MRNPWIKLSITALIVLLTALLVYQYVAVTLLPAEITIATGLEGGRFYSLGQSIKAAIEKKHGVRVHVLSTDGSLDNLKHLHTGKADFAIYQPYTLEIFHELDRKDALSAIDFPIQDFPFDIAENIQFAANLYYQVVHLIIRNDLNVDSPTELTGKTWERNIPAIWP